MLFRSHMSPHHLGQNDRGTKYLDLELFVRDGSHVARGLEFLAKPPISLVRADGRAGPRPVNYGSLKA